MIPLPMLDGGHLVYCAIELIRGRALSEALRLRLQQLGLTAILALTSLDFLGLGVPPGTPSLGELLAQGKNNIDAWWISMSTFALLVVTLLLLTFMGDALRNACLGVFVQGPQRDHLGGERQIQNRLIGGIDLGKRRRRRHARRQHRTDLRRAARAPAAAAPAPVSTADPAAAASSPSATRAGNVVRECSRRSSSASRWARVSRAG